MHAPEILRVTFCAFLHNSAIAISSILKIIILTPRCCRIVKTLGPLPEKWRSRKFDNNGYPVEASDDRIHDAEQLEYEPLGAPLIEAVREIEADPMAKNHDGLEGELWTPKWESTDMDDSEMDDLEMGDDSNSTNRISKEEAGLLFDLLSKIFKFSPEQRLGLKEIADHPWFNFRS
jgi:hypothetical protein